MKQIVSFSLISVVFISSCINNVNSKQTGTKETLEIAASTELQYDKILGSYVGDFGNNKITLLITKATADSVEGRSVVGGNDRPFAGTVNFNNGVYAIAAKEPGDDKHDGVFEFKINDANSEKLEGAWTPKTATKEITSKTYSLTNKTFAYRADVGDFPEASTRLLKDKDINNFGKLDLEYMRNEIFARHGYCFKKRELRNMFEPREWYVPNSVNIKGDLTEVEKKNIALIKKYEKYAKDYGDDFGR